jgi:hypothetical protein
MQGACAVLYSSLWPLPLCHIFQNFLINGTIFWKMLLIIICVFIFSTTLIWKHYHSKNNSARYYHKREGLHVKYRLFLSGWIFSTCFRKILKCQISWKSVQLEQRSYIFIRFWQHLEFNDRHLWKVRNIKFHGNPPIGSSAVNGRTDITKPTGALSDCANAPKTEICHNY